ESALRSHIDKTDFVVNKRESTSYLLRDGTPGRGADWLAGPHPPSRNDRSEFRGPRSGFERARNDPGHRSWLARLYPSPEKEETHRGRHGCRKRNSLLRAAGQNQRPP